MVHYFFKASVVAGVVLVMYLVSPSCSETYFGSIKTVSCVDFVDKFGADNCKPAPAPPSDVPFYDDSKYLQFNYDVYLGEVDIIFVIDNSSSMHEEHKNIARQMRDFLDHIRHLNYRLAVITTDISSSPNNPRSGASYQDGKFIRIGTSGRPYLENTLPGQSPRKGEIVDFVSAIERPETLACGKESAGTQSVDLDFYYEHGYYPDQEKGEAPPEACPSSDERGIYALNLALENPAHSDFFRRDAHLMMVILSDEDERSSESYIRQKLDRGFTEYVFEERDYPETLVETVYNRLGALKTFSVHSIIIPPRDNRCLQEQNRNAYSGSGSGRGFYGAEYARLSKAKESDLLKYGNLLKGSVLSICDRSYPRQLSRVALFADIPRISLPCGDPEYIKVHLNGREQRIYYDIEGRSLQLRPGSIPLGSEVQVTVVCKEE